MRHTWTNVQHNFGPIFITFFLFLFFGLKPQFLQCFQQNANFKDTPKKKKHTICEHTCANCSCQHVRFFLHFFFILGIFSISCFWRDVLIGRQKSRNTKFQRGQKQEIKMQTIRNSNRVIQNKTRQQAEKQIRGTS